MILKEWRLILSLFLMSLAYILSDSWPINFIFLTGVGFFTLGVLNHIK